MLPDEAETLERNERRLTISGYKFNTIVDFSDNAQKPQETDEKVAKGAVKMSVYLRYIKAGGFHQVFLLILLNIVFISSVTWFDYGLVAW